MPELRLCRAAGAPPKQVTTLRTSRGHGLPGEHPARGLTPRSQPGAAGHGTADSGALLIQRSVARLLTQGSAAAIALADELSLQLIPV